MHCNETPSCNYCFQGELVPEYNVTTMSKAFVGDNFWRAQHSVVINQWMRPLKIAELVVHKKYNRKGQDSKVAEF